MRKLLDGFVTLLCGIVLYYFFPVGISILSKRWVSMNEILASTNTPILVYVFIFASVWCMAHSLYAVVSYIRTVFFVKDKEEK